MRPIPFPYPEVEPTPPLEYAVTEAVAGELENFLRQDEAKELLRFSTAGSVDDGKSTLIGRLLFDTKMVYEDQLAAVQQSKVNRSSGPIDFSLLTDGLRAEREQGITIDVAYRYFATARRKFIIADTPGHEQYTRNMATGASTADLAIILIDARNGVLPQSRRHAFIASLLGIPKILVAVNKMDLVDYRQEVFDRITDEFRHFTGQLGLRDLYFLPISALEGDNVVTPSSRTSWFDGPPLLEYLETVPLAKDREAEEFRFPVQYVIRPDLAFRGYAGQVASGIVREGDPITVLPSGRTSRVKSIVTWEGDRREAYPPLSVTLTLEDEVDVSRGDMLVHPYHLPHVARRFEAMLVWMHHEPMEPGKEYFIKHTTQQIRGKITQLSHRVDINSLDHKPAERLELNEIGRIALELNRPIFFDRYEDNRITGGFILIDPQHNSTVAAGMIVEEVRPESLARSAKADEEAETRVTLAERIAVHGHAPGIVSLGARSTLAQLIERKLFDRGIQVAVVENAIGLGDAVQALYNAGFVILALHSEPADLDKLRTVSGTDRFLHLETLAASDPAAAQQILDLLEKRKWIRPSDRFQSGEGI